MHYVPFIHVRMSACQSYARHTFLFRLFCINMLLYVSIYLSVTFIHTYIVLAISTVIIILTQDCPHVVGVSMCCSRYDQHSCCFYHLWARCKHRFEDAEVKNFASVNIVLTTITTVSTIVAHQSEDYDCLSVCLSFFRLFRYAYIQLCIRHIHEQFYRADVWWWVRWSSW